jgi:CBS-domain-containing membrane protein
MANSGMIQLLETTTADSLTLRHQFVTTVRKEETLRTAFEQLIINDIYSAPVWDESHKKYIGMLDLVDIAKLVTNIFTKHTVLASLQRTDIHQLQEEFYNTQVKDIINLSGRNPFRPLAPSATLLQVVQHLTTAHRIPIVNESGEVVNVLSEARILQFIAKNADKLGDLAEKTVKELRLGYGKVLTIDNQTRAIDAFAHMTSHNFSSAAIVDAQHSLHGNISIKDLKGLLADFGRLLLPVEEYINIIRRQNLRDIFPSIHCYESYTLLKVIQKFAATGVHRLYLLSDDTHQLQGVISLEDLLKMLLRLYSRNVE